MVTSNKFPDKKVVKMSEHKNISVVPQRTLLGEVNEHITCPICRGYYIDATTIVECLHSFCRSCIIKHLQIKSYCPVCELMINLAKPNIKLDKALQDIVYKLVPGLFQREMDRRQQFYSSRPGPAATATPEQRGEDTERIIFSPEDVISFSLEYADMTDTDSISSKSSDSNEPHASATSRRYLQCPAVVNISHLKKFLTMKFDIDSTQYAIDILYKRVPLPDYYTLMDIAYIYNWKRNEPMRFFYQIIDYVAIRNRLFDINRKESHLGDRKPSPTSTEDTNVSSPAHPMNDHGSEASSGTDSPMPDDSNSKQVSEKSKNNTDKLSQQSKEMQDNTKSECPQSSKSNVEDVEKSQFLNSFELTAKNNSPNSKTSPTKGNIIPDVSTGEPSVATSKIATSPKVEDTLKRKQQTPPNTPEMKKIRIEIEKAKINFGNNSSNVMPVSQSNQSGRSMEITSKMKEITSKSSTVLSTSSSPSTIVTPTKEDRKDIKQPYQPAKQPVSENIGIKRTIAGAQNNVSSPTKRKQTGDLITHLTAPSTIQKTVSPIKIQVPRMETVPVNNKVTDVPVTTPTVKKMPDLKPSSIATQSFPNKQPVNKIRMDLLANNSDIDRSKILPQIKSPIGMPNTVPNSGDPLKSLFDSCKINIPSSLSITLTDQKLETRNTGDPNNPEQKKGTVNKNLAAASNPVAHKVPSPPVHNYIQILKLPDTDPKKSKPENNSETKLSQPNKTDPSSSQPKPNKSSETSAKGPIPNLKPIADTKIAKQSGNLSAPITFQQTFEQQLQTMQSDKKSKLSKNKPQVPKLVPATPKALSAANKPNVLNNKPNTSDISVGETKASSALDLSTSHSIQSQLGPQQTFDKAFETMQSIANLAKKQNLQSKGLPLPMPQSSMFSNISNRPVTTGAGPLRIPSTTSTNQLKHDKMPIPTHSNSTRQEVSNKNNTLKLTSTVSSTVPSPSYPVASHSSPNTAQPSPRSQTRSPSSSPKLVIAEEKQVTSCSDQNLIQSNQMLTSQMSNMGGMKNDPSKVAAGPSKTGLKPVKHITSTSKMPLMRQTQNPNMKPNPMLNNSDYQDLLRRHQIEMNNWIKVHQRHYDMYKNTLAQPGQNDFSNKDKQ